MTVTAGDTTALIPVAAMSKLLMWDRRLDAINRLVEGAHAEPRMKQLKPGSNPQQ